MPRFPDPLFLPQEVYDSRRQRYQDVLRAAKWGISFRIFVILFELIGVFYIHSSAVFLDAISNVADVLSSLSLVFCIMLAQRPPDRNHPFGHGRYEPFGGLFLGVFLSTLGGVMLIQEILNLYQEPVHHVIHAWAWIFPAIAMAALEIAYRILMHAAKKIESPALVADAMHYRLDSLTSFFATVALGVAAFSPQWGWMIDHLGAMLIALFMVMTGIIAARDNFHQLMDRVPDEKFFDLVRQAALKTEGVQETEKIRIQQYGPDAHVNIDIEVDPLLSVAKAHRVSQKVRREIQKAWPSVRDVTVHIEPYYANDH